MEKATKHRGRKEVENGSTKVRKHGVTVFFSAQSLRSWYLELTFGHSHILYIDDDDGRFHEVTAECSSV